MVWSKYDRCWNNKQLWALGTWMFANFSVFTCNFKAHKCQLREWKADVERGKKWQTDRRMLGEFRSLWTNIHITCLSAFMMCISFYYATWCRIVAPQNSVAANYNESWSLMCLWADCVARPFLSQVSVILPWGWEINHRVSWGMFSWWWQRGRKKTGMSEAVWLGSSTLSFHPPAEVKEVTWLSPRSTGKEIQSSCSKAGQGCGRRKGIRFGQY